MAEELADSFEHIVDDSADREAAADWAYDQSAAGRTPEEVVEALVAGGWPFEVAADLAEQARRQTRALRGVKTRDDVARLAESSYRKSMGRLPMFAFGFIVGLPIALGNVVRSFASMRRLARSSPRRDPDKDASIADRDSRTSSS